MLRRPNPLATCRCGTLYTTGAHHWVFTCSRFVALPFNKASLTRCIPSTHLHRGSASTVSTLATSTRSCSVVMNGLAARLLQTRQCGRCQRCSIPKEQPVSQEEACSAAWVSGKRLGQCQWQQNISSRRSCITGMSACGAPMYASGAHGFVQSRKGYRNLPLTRRHMTAQILNVAVHSPTQPNRYGCILQRERQRYAHCCTD